MTGVVVTELTIFPVKALDPLSLQGCELLPSGALRGDRRFALVDERGDYVNGKRERRVHQIRTRYEESGLRGRLWFGESAEPPSDAIAFDLSADRDEFGQRISPYLGYRVSVVEDAVVGFPDDLDASGPTIVSRETLAAFGEEFGLSLDEMRRRFRANVEIVGGGALWEDRGFGPPGTVVPLRIGEATLFGSNPCRRCAVPGRDSWTGQTDPGFAVRLSRQREATLPDFADRERFDGNWYRLALNTRPDPRFAPPRTIAVGDVVEILGDPIAIESIRGEAR